MSLPAPACIFIFFCLATQSTTQARPTRGSQVFDRDRRSPSLLSSVSTPEPHSCLAARPPDPHPCRAGGGADRPASRRMAASAPTGRPGSCALHRAGASRPGRARSAPPPPPAAAAAATESRVCSRPQGTAGRSDGPRLDQQSRVFVKGESSAHTVGCIGRDVYVVRS